MPMTVAQPSELGDVLTALRDRDTYGSRVEATRRALADNNDEAQRAALRHLYDPLFEVMS